jgi:sugar transferase (PEP-CTERM/EpsH1 system associated)
MHVVFSFDVGGLENGVVNLINHMPGDRFRHIVVALTRCAFGFSKRITREDVEFVSLDKSPGHAIKLYPRLYRLFRDYRPAVVHTRNLAALEAVVPARAAGVPVRVHGEHGWDVSDPQGTQRKFQLMRRLYRPFVDRYVALSRHLSCYLTEAVGVPAARVERICNGVDTVRFHPGPEGRSRLDGCPFGAPDEVLIGTVGRLQAVKDQRSLVRAFAHLVAQRAPGAERLRLAIAGEGPIQEQLEAEILAGGIGTRVWLGGARADVPEVMRSLDVFVLPSLAEGISNTILEAMASGLPVVATAVGGNPELVEHRRTGTLVPPADYVALADALAPYIADPLLRRRHGEAGRRRVEAEFSLDHMVDRYVALYQTLIDAATPPRVVS